MERTSVESASIRSIGYDRPRHVLEIEFRSGAIYEYAEVPQRLYEEMLLTESKGRFFQTRIDKHFAFEQVGGIELADVAQEAAEAAMLADDVETAPAPRHRTAHTSASRHTWVVDVLEDDSAAIEVDGRQVTAIPRWLLPTNAKEGDVLTVAHKRRGTRSLILITVDHEATREAYERSERQIGG